MSWDTLQSMLAATMGGVFPVHATGQDRKRPYRRFRWGAGAQHSREGVRKLWEAHASSHEVGWGCKLPGDLLVLDFDGPPDTRRAFLDAWEIPDTLTVTTPRPEDPWEGEHRYLSLSPVRGQTPHIKAGGTGLLAPGIDWKCGAGGNAYVVIPPTAGYTVAGDLEIALCPERLVVELERLSREDDRSGDASLGLIGPTPKGGRHAALISLVGMWIEEGVPYVQGLERALAWNAHNLPPLEAPEVERTVRDGYRRWGKRGVPLTPPVATEIPDPSQPRYPTADRAVWEAVPWILRPLLFRGGLSYLTGDPDVGKSTLLCAVTAALTTGRSLPWEPPGLSDPLRVAWILYEDSFVQTIGPRLEAARADLSRVKIIPGARASGGSEVEVVSYDDLERLRGDLQGYDLLICDALNAFVPAGLDMAKGPHVRRLLAGFGALLGELDLAALFVRHDRKGGGEKALYRSSGILDWTAAARVEVTMARVPEDEEGSEERPPYALAYRKNNLVHPDERQTWGYSIEPVEVTIGGARQTMPVVEWAGRLEMTADQIVQSPVATGAVRTSLAQKVQSSVYRLYRGGAHDLMPDWLKAEAGRHHTTVRRIRESLEPVADEQEDGSWQIRPPV